MERDKPVPTPATKHEPLICSELMFCISRRNYLSLFESCTFVLICTASQSATPKSAGASAPSAGNNPGTSGRWMPHGALMCRVLLIFCKVLCTDLWKKLKSLLKLSRHKYTSRLPSSFGFFGPLAHLIGTFHDVDDRQQGPRETSRGRSM